MNGRLRWCLVVAFSFITLISRTHVVRSSDEGVSVAPLLEITEPIVCAGLTPADVGPVMTYRWHAAPGSADPAEVRYILVSTSDFGNSYAQTIQYIRTVPNAPEWSAWQPYLAPDVGTSWTTPPQDYGDYVFAVHGRDSEGNTEALFVEPRNVRRIKIMNHVNGPVLTVTSPHHDPIVTSVVAPTVSIDLLSETPIVFCWSADACVYGGSVGGYRYAWDLTDPDDDSQWGMPFTPFASAQECSPVMTSIPDAVHTFYVEAIDNTGHKSRASVQVTWHSGGWPPNPWSRRYGDVSVQHSKGVAVNDASDVFAVGEFDGTISFGGGPFTGSSDIFLAKLNRFGTHMWSKAFPGTGLQSMRDVAVDAAGNVFIFGDFVNTVDFGGGPLTSFSSNTDVFLAKFDPNGAHLWSKRFGGNGEDRASAVAVDGAGNVVITGEIFVGTASFGGPNLPAGMYAAKYGPTGTYAWSRALGGAFGSFADVQTDAAGDVVLGGHFSGTANFGGGDLAASGSDVFVAKLDPNGVHLWSRRAGDALDQYGAGVAADPLGNVVLAGSFYGTVDTGNGPLTSAGSTDLLLAAFDDDGTPLWSRRFGDASTQVATGVAVGDSRNLVVTGYFSGAVDFGETPLTSAGLADFFVAKFDAAGNHMMSQKFGDATNQLAIEVDVDAFDVPVVFGEFNGTVDFGTGALTSAGSQDVVLARLDFSVPVDVESPVMHELGLRSYPNPFNPMTTIAFDVPSSGRVTLAVYDVRGALVRTVVDAAMPAGTHEVRWDGRDARGALVSSGVYFARLEFGVSAVVRKLTLLK